MNVTLTVEGQTIIVRKAARQIQTSIIFDESSKIYMDLQYRGGAELLCS